MLYKKQSRVLCLIYLAALFAAVPKAPAFQLSPREAPEWIKTLESPERISGLKIPEVIAKLRLRSGEIVADIGAGSGAFTRPLAQAVGPKGKVYAVDIQQGLLDYINQRDKEEKIGNVQTVLGGFDDPKLPARNVDLGFINDVLHHIEHRELYLKALASYIKPKGRIVIIDLNKDDPKNPHKDKPELLLSREQVDQWLASVGFHPVEEFTDVFPSTKWFVSYGRK